MQVAFSERIDWGLALTLCRQKPDILVKAFGLRLKVTPRKCNLGIEQTEQLCLSLLKENSLPHICKNLRSCMPGTTLEQALNHAIQYERSGDAKMAK